MRELDSATKQALVTALLFAITPFLVFSRLRYLLGSHFARLKLVFLRETNVKANEGAEMKVSGIFIYPVKSLRAVSVQSCELDSFGFVNDRRLMVVKPCLMPNKGFFAPGDATHRFVTQRQAPSLTKIIPSLPSGGASSTIALHAPNQKKCIAIDVSDKAIASYKQYVAGIWDDKVGIADVGDEAATFVQDVIAEGASAGEFDNVRVVVMPPNYKRNADGKYVPIEAMHSGRNPNVGLSDGFPFLIASESSLVELNRRIVAKGKNSVPMIQFRPNIVVSGTEPFEEDTWKAIKVGPAIFHVVKGCPRCKQSCTNQITGEVSEEPLETLAEFRALGDNKEEVFFAQNAIAQNTCGRKVCVGDVVTVLSKGKPIFE